MGSIDEQVAKLVVLRLVSDVECTERPKQRRVINPVGLHEFQEVVEEGLILGGGGEEPKFFRHQVGVITLERGFVDVQGFFERFFGGQREQRLREATEVPQPDGGLLIKRVPAVVIGMVADQPRVVVVEKAERPVIQSDPVDGHVVGVHDSMRPPDRLPSGDEMSRADHHLMEQGGVGVFAHLQVREMLVNDIIGEAAQVVILVSIVEHFEGAESHMGGSHPKQHGPAFDLLSVDCVLTPDHAERSGGGNAQPMHGFAAEVFPDCRPKDRTPIATSRIGGEARSFEVQIPFFPGVVSHFAQENGPSVSQLRDVDAELMAGVDHGERFRSRQEQPAPEASGKFRTGGFFGIQVDQFGRSGIDADPIRRLGKRRGRQLCVKRFRETCIGVVEREGFEGSPDWPGLGSHLFTHTTRL